VPRDQRWRSGLHRRGSRAASPVYFQVMRT
jgi:hypothetical protein